MAAVRLTVGELSRADPRPIRDVLRDAVTTADNVLRSYQSAVLHGDEDQDTIARLIEAAKYASTLAKIALDAGVPDESSTVDTAQEAVEVATRALVLVIDMLLDDALTDAVDPPWRHVLRTWCLTALQAALTGREPPAIPERPPLPELPPMARSRPASGNVDEAADTVDAEVLDPDEDLPGDAELISEYQALTGRQYAPG
jgi:hypothetical protein